MHKSRLAGFIIDCQTQDLESATRFWSAALGLTVRPPTETKYRTLATAPDDVHLDIETDDLEAEVRRLERLGARRIGALRTWYVMEAPTGQRFCVVRPQRADFEARANHWSEEA